jgi:D-amino-acid dehydrogenase
MRIAVIGAGIVGVCTAWELRQDGHEVTVFERRSGVAAEGSFANAGLISAGPIAPWATSALRGRLWRQWLGRPTTLHWHPSLDAAQWRWLWRFWHACTPAHFERDRAQLQRLAQLSQKRLHEINERLGLEYERSRGQLILLRGEREMAQSEALLNVLRDTGVSHRVLDARQSRGVEPALNPDQPLTGAIHLPDDEVGNCRQFAHLLREAAEGSGVEFRFATVVKSISAGAAGTKPSLDVEQLPLTTSFAHSRAAIPAQQHLARRARTAARYLDPVSNETYDAVVLCAGAAAAGLLAGLGVSVPLMPVYGYTVSAPLRTSDRGPRAAVTDDRLRVTITRLGQRVRVAGGADLGGRVNAQNHATVARLYKVLDDWFPGAAHIARPQLWKGARAMLPDGPPIISAAQRAGVWLNLGHGASGWTLACGSARLLADAIAQREPAMDLAPFDVRRYGRG